MSYLDQITPVHMDILKEIGNIGAGNAATALSKIMDKRIEMQVPTVRIVSFDEMMEIAGGAENIAAIIYLKIEGDVPSHIFFVLPLENGERLVRQMTGNDSFSFTAPTYDELSISALQEIGNILVGSYITSLSDFTGLKMHPSVPAMSIDMIGAVISFGIIELSRFSDYVVVIETSFKDADNNQTKSIDGHFFLFPDPESFEKIFRSLGVAMDE